MVGLVFVSVLSFSILSSTANAQEFSADSNCLPVSAAEEHLRESDFEWNISIEKILELFEKTYLSVKRLPARAYWNSEKNSLVLPYLPERGGDVLLSARFAESLQSHIEQALAKKYAEAIIFPDMGHSHFLIPEKKWNNVYDKYPVDQFSQMYSALFADSKVQVLYHTAEMLQTLDENKQVLNNPHIQWRHRTRNVVGANNPNAKIRILQNPESAANTVGHVPGFFWFSSGYNISAHEKGCLRYQHNGKTFRFDISLFDLQ